jgi:site-specific DNA recombinase
MDELEKLKKENLELKKEISELRSFREKQRKGMISKASKGNLMSRVPFGYKLINKKLVPAENSRNVEEIFQDFLDSNSSLTKLSQKYGFSVNGLKKILMNFTYIGKIKFDGQIHQGSHESLVSSTLFNHVQNKLGKLGIKN